MHVVDKSSFQMRVEAANGGQSRVPIRTQSLFIRKSTKTGHAGASFPDRILTSASINDNGAMSIQRI
jgi:hypothetical protein